MVTIGNTQYTVEGKKVRVYTELGGGHSTLGVYPVSEFVKRFKDKELIKVLGLNKKKVK